MIKPGTLCMIRGVPTGMIGGDCNGKIVTVVQKIAELYMFVPQLYTQTGVKGWVDTSVEKYLFPFEDFDPQELIEKELETV
jgi:chitinase